MHPIPPDDLTAPRTARQVADLLDLVAAADLRATVRDLEDLVAVLRPAVGARAVLAHVDADTLREALEIRVARALAGGAP